MKNNKNKNQINAKKIEKPVKVEEHLESVRIRKIGVLSLSMTLALINVIVGLILGLFFVIFSFIGGGITTTVPGVPKSLELIFGAAAIAIFPISLGIAGFIQGLIIGILYNFASKISKGVRLYS